MQNPDDRLVPYGWTESVAARFAPFAAHEGQPGRVTRVDRGRYQVVTSDGAATCSESGGSLRSGSERLPVGVGDWIAMTATPSRRWRLAAIVPRTTAVLRSDPNDSGLQVLAANVDVALLLFGIDRPFKPGRLERMAAIVMESGVTPVVVLTKVDLVAAEAAPPAARIAATAMGIAVVEVSAVTGDGLAPLGSHLGAGTTAVLLGESGAGKSTLVNRLAVDAGLTVGRTRHGDAKGRHTTTARQMVPVAGGAVLIDTPGLRAVALSDVPHGVEAAFPDVVGLAAGCRFRDCAHMDEPGCAVRDAVESGALEGRRLVSYHQLQREAGAQVRRGIQRARRRGRAARDGADDPQQWERE